MVAEVVLVVSVFPIVTWLRSIAIAIGLLIIALQQSIGGTNRLIFGINYPIYRILTFGLHLLGSAFRGREMQQDSRRN